MKTRVEAKAVEVPRQKNADLNSEQPNHAPSSFSVVRNLIVRHQLVGILIALAVDVNCSS